jgi:nitrate/nitrite transporter NarK
LTVFLLNQTTAMIYVWFILWGLGFGANLTIGTTAMVRYFGRKAYGSIDGSYGLLYLPIGVIAPIYIGWLYDTTGSYTTAFILLAVSLTVTGVLFPFIKPPKPPAEITGIRQLV